MSEALNNPVKRQYTRKEISTADMPIGQKADIDLGDLINFIRGESLADNVGEKPLTPEFLAELAFNEEPVTVRIEENSRSDFPETHAACAVNGRGAEVLHNGQWISMTWLPIGQVLTIKRKYVEVLARAKSDSIQTVHQDATVERPNNTVRRRTSSNYPLSIIEDRNPKGHEWLSRIMMGH